jgi:hypothetical protein
LLARVKEQHADYLPALQQAMDTYQPCLVVNQVTDREEVAPIVRRIQDVSRRMLGIRIRYLGALPYLEEVKQSALELVPAVARNSRGILARRMAAMIRGL